MSRVSICLLLLGLAALTAAVSKLTPGLTPGAKRRCPHVDCLRDQCSNINCSGGIVVDNEHCPCCYVCAMQRDQECDAQTEDKQTAYRYCDAGLECGTVGYEGTGRLIGRCVGELLPVTSFTADQLFIYGLSQGDKYSDV